ncbi:MAG: Rhomboid family protein [Sphingomonas bacterium]|nr:Rhomboid family protein [Sphingomonas bacterium]
MRLPPARATTVLAVVTAAAWALVAMSGMADQAQILGAFIPARASGLLDLPGAVPAWLTPITALLLHAGILHLGFNLLMLGFCGRYVEVAVGWIGVAILYVTGAYAAALGQYLLGPSDPSPMIGASGAISALLGAYALLYGERRATLANRRLNGIVNILWLAAAWIGLQLLVGIALSNDSGRIAVGAHVGGFLVGLALARPLLLWRHRTA